jgi:hypothetical protein
MWSFVKVMLNQIDNVHGIQNYYFVDNCEHKDFKWVYFDEVYERFKCNFLL